MGDRLLEQLLVVLDIQELQRNRIQDSLPCAGTPQHTLG